LRQKTERNEVTRKMAGEEDEKEEKDPNKERYRIK